MNSGNKYSYLFPRAAHTVDAIIIVFEDQLMKIALIQRKFDPFKGKWALPGGFVNMDETLADACIRELEEETGIKIDDPVFFGVYDAIHRDPRGRTISSVFYKVISSVPALNAEDDAESARWFDTEDLPELAFDHQTIIADFLKRINLSGRTDSLVQNG